MGGPQYAREVKIRGVNQDQTVTSTPDGASERLDVSAKLAQDMVIPEYDQVDWSDSSAIKFYSGTALVATITLTATTATLS